MKTKNLIILMLMTISIISITSCKKDDDIPTPTALTPSVSNASFEFLNTGNKWTYNYTTWFGDNEVLTQEIISVSNSKYRVVSIINSDTVLAANWYASGQYLKTLIDGEAEAESIYKFNPSLNDTWTAQGSSNSIITYRVVKLNDTIATTFGEFYDCVKIEVTFSDSFNTQYNYWSKKYGLVYQEGAAGLDLINKNF